MNDQKIYAEEGVLPMEWRRANVKFLKKLNKTNYNLPSPYGPISLTSVVVKMMERIIKFRLDVFVERFHILDAEQEGSRHFRSTVKALLSLTQEIFSVPASRRYRNNRKYRCSLHRTTI